MPLSALQSKCFFMQLIDRSKKISSFRFKKVQEFTSGGMRRGLRVGMLAQVEGCAWHLFVRMFVVIANDSELFYIGREIGTF